MTNEQEVREAFERRFADHAWFNPYSMDEDSYLDGSTNLAWEVWKAAAQSIRDQDAAKRARLVGVLEEIGRKSEAGLCSFSHAGARAFHNDIRGIVSNAISSTVPEAEAFIREKQAEALEDAAVTHETWHGFDKNGTAAWLREMAADLRNAKE